MTTNATRIQTASEWFIRLRESPDDGELVVEWLKWCQEDPANLQAFSEAARVWRICGDVGEPQQSKPAPRSPRRFRWAYAAAIAAMLLVGVTFVWRMPILPSNAIEYATAHATQRSVRLSDGSVLELGAASTVRVSYSATRRDLELLQGEAYFDVQHASRPFVVRTAGSSVRAVGTRFNVRTGAMRTVVTVSEGVVEIAPAGEHSSNGSVRANAGQQVSIDLAGGGRTVQLTDVPLTRDWQDGMLSFVDEPLRAVVERINRYSAEKISLDDGAISELRFTGTVRNDEIADWARGLDRVFPIRIERHDSDGLHLTARDRTAR